jgi:large subunit ribosomal protein L20
LELDRKVLSAIAFDDPASFAEIVQAVKGVSTSAEAAAE